MTIRELQDDIIRLKKEKGIRILAHAYRVQKIWEVIDYIGDSFGLSQKAIGVKEQTVLMYGVRFMAETVKILSPQKRVLLENSIAGEEIVMSDEFIVSSRKCIDEMLRLGE